jgi:hypothetical protein
MNGLTLHMSAAETVSLLYTFVLVKFSIFSPVYLLPKKEDLD